MSDVWQPPRCSHGKILLGCPHDDCPEQNAYLADQQAAFDRYNERLLAEHREALAALARDHALEEIRRTQDEGS